MRGLPAVPALIGLISLIGLTACSSWPDYGRGGMAENRPLAYPERALGAVVTQADALYSRLALAERHLDILRLKGAELCLPATVHKVAIRLARTRRELQGQLTLDAANDQLLVESQLIALEQRLDYLLENGSCVLDSTPETETIAEQLNRLLNCNNLFVHDSARLNPLYLTNLERATDLLQQQPELRVQIKGHTDNTGTPLYNQALSLRRAQAVRDQLLAKGLPAGQLILSAVGETQPVVTNASAEGRLLNRRVEISVAGELSCGLAPEEDHQ